jgi:SAM-dependent MidA family methyltransferase
MEDDLMEIFVNYDNGFKEVLRPAKDELRQYLDELKITLPRHFQTEINLQATNWITEVAGALNRGYVLTIDYGYQSADLYKPCRSQGTVVCYHKHTVNECAYDYIGKQDITSHVNFSALTHWGSKNGLHECGFTDQSHFLLALGFTDYINNTLSHDKDIASAARKASMLTHTLLTDMGSKFKVLIQEKGECERRLSGLRLSNVNPFH